MAAKGGLINFNTILLGGLTVVTTISGWGLNHAYANLEDRQRELQQIIMPKTEILLRLDEMRVTLDEMRVKIASLELDMQRMRNK